MTMSILTNILAFIVAVGVLVTFHEFGHYWVAKKLGVKVLRFSIGFGKPLWTWVAGRDRTEYVIAAIPLGGFVKMLDEREGDVEKIELERAFNRQTVWRRIAIVAAGPLANIVFAVLAYWCMFVIGVNGIKPVIGEVTPDSIAADAGLRSGDQIVAVGQQDTPTWQVATLSLLQQALEKGTVDLEARDSEGGVHFTQLNLNDTRTLLDDGDFLQHVGIKPWRPVLDPIIGEQVADGAAKRSGLQKGDRILSANGQTLTTWSDLVDVIKTHADQKIAFEVERDGQVLPMEIHTDAEVVDGKTIGRIGAYAYVDKGQFDEMRVTVRYGVVESLFKGMNKTWDISILTLRVLGKLVIGEASLKNISGPVTIAEFAGVSATIGVSAFLSALALFSISIGILNLLPVPVLDGGHLLFYTIELIKGSPVSELTEAIGQRIGLAMLAGLMSLAFYNDLVRLLS